MSEGSQKLFQAQKDYASAQGKDANTDNDLDRKRHDRGYNPIDDAEQATISEKLNGDAGRYRKGPGPF